MNVTSFEIGSNSIDNVESSMKRTVDIGIALIVKWR